MVRKSRSNAARRKALDTSVNDDPFAHFSEVTIPPVAEVGPLLQQLYDRAPKPGQLQAVERLIANEDTIFIAKTGYGKSMIFHSVSALCPGSIALIIMPLNALQMDQIDDIKRLTVKGYSMKPCVLNSNTMTDTLLKHIREGRYTHVLTGPEIVLENSKFRSVLQHSDFQRRLKLLAIDEAHVIVSWGDEFRPAYGRLGELRSLFPSDVPWLAVSATMDPSTLKAVMKSLRFDDKLVPIKTSINREDVFINVQKIQKTFVSFEDLRFLTNTNPDTKLIKRKAVVYGNTIAELLKMVDALRRFYREASKCDEETAGQHIRLYHGELSLSGKSTLQADFKRENSDIRIICSTEALGMGMNISDIDIVVQWREPPSMRELWQRAGRVARAPDLPGEFLWLYSPWTEGDLDHEITKSSAAQVENAKDDSLASDQSDMDDASANTLSKKAKKKKPLTALDRRIALGPGLYRLVNHTECCRKIELEFFDEIQPISEKCGSLIPNGCCSRCSPMLGCTEELTASIKAPSKRPKRSPAEKTEKRHRVSVEARLTRWRTHKAPEIFSTFMAVMCPEAYATFLPPRMVKAIAQDCMSLKSVDDLRNIAHDWEWLDDYAEELWDCVQDARSNAKIFGPQQEDQAGSSVQSSLAIGKAAESAESAELPLQSNDQLIEQSSNDASLFISSSSIKSPAKKKAKTPRSSRPSSIKSSVKRKARTFRSPERSPIKSPVKKKAKTLRSSQPLINYNKIRSPFQGGGEQSAISEDEMSRKELSLNASSGRVRTMRRTALEHSIRFERLAPGLLFGKRKEPS